MYIGRAFFCLFSVLLLSLPCKLVAVHSRVLVFVEKGGVTGAVSSPLVCILPLLFLFLHFSSFPSFILHTYLVFVVDSWIEKYNNSFPTFLRFLFLLFLSFSSASAHLDSRPAPVSTG